MSEIILSYPEPRGEYQSPSLAPIVIRDRSRRLDLTLHVSLSDAETVNFATGYNRPGLVNGIEVRVRGEAKLVDGSWSTRWHTQVEREHPKPDYDRSVSYAAADKVNQAVEAEINARLVGTALLRATAEVRAAHRAASYIEADMEREAKRAAERMETLQAKLDEANAKVAAAEAQRQSLAQEQARRETQASADDSPFVSL